MEDELNEKWPRLLSALEEKFGGDLDIQAILFLVGVQELGQGRRKLTKDQKLDVMHIAICTLLEPYGYYTFEGKDADNWPHWKATSKLPHLKPGQQQRLMQEALVDYFEKEGVI